MVAVKRDTPYNLDPVFEKNMVTLACCNARFYGRIGNTIDPELLRSESAKHAMRAAHAIYKSSGHGPNNKDSESELRSSCTLGYLCDVTVL